MRSGWCRVEMEVEMEVMVEIEVMGGGGVGPMCLYFYRTHTYICNAKIFYKTMKYKMYEWYF